MKKVILISALAAFALTATSQDSSRQRTISDSLSKVTTSKNFLIMDSGRLVIVMGGSRKTAKASQSLGNGTVVRPNGEVLLKDGKTAELKEGDKIFFDGTISRKDDIKGLREPST